MTWLNGLVTCDVVTMARERVTYGLAVQKNGRIVSDMFVIATDDKLLVFVPSSVADSLCASLDAYLIMEDATIRVGDYALFGALGPRTASLPSVGDDMKWHSRGYDGFGVPALLVAAPKAVANEAKAYLRDAVLGEGGATGTVEEWAQLRAHGFIPEFSLDFDASMYPQEAGLETRAVSFTKGCYLGQEVVCMLEMRGQVRRKLVMLSYEGEPLPAKTAVVAKSGDSAGETKSAAVSLLENGRSLGFAMVKRTLADVGSELVIASGDGSSRVARVVERTWP